MGIWKGQGEGTLRVYGGYRGWSETRGREQGRWTPSHVTKELWKALGQGRGQMNVKISIVATVVRTGCRKEPGRWGLLGVLPVMRTGTRGNDFLGGTPTPRVPICCPQAETKAQSTGESRGHTPFTCHTYASTLHVGGLCFALVGHLRRLKGRGLPRFTQGTWWSRPDCSLVSLWCPPAGQG
jgi:hypothetical protein